jgi:hypothetical protein
MVFGSNKSKKAAKRRSRSRKNDSASESEALGASGADSGDDQGAAAAAPAPVQKKGGQGVKGQDKQQPGARPRAPVSTEEDHQSVLATQAGFAKEAKERKEVAKAQKQQETAEAAAAALAELAKKQREAAEAATNLLPVAPPVVAALPAAVSPEALQTLFATAYAACQAANAAAAVSPKPPANAAPKPAPKPRAAAPKPVSKKRTQLHPIGDDGGTTSGAENENEEGSKGEKAVQSRRSKGPAREKPELSNDVKVKRGRLTNQLRKHMRKWYEFIRHYQRMADEIGCDVCNYDSTDADLELPGAMERPSRIDSESTNTQELTREFIIGALPNRKYNKDDLFPRVVLKFEDPLQDLIDTDEPELQAGASKKSCSGGGGGGRSSSGNKRRKTNEGDGGGSGTE